MTTREVEAPAPEAGDLDCYYPAGCRWLDGCNAESTCIGAEAQGQA